MLKGMANPLKICFYMDHPMRSSSGGSAMFENNKYIFRRASITLHPMKKQIVPADIEYYVEQLPQDIV